MVGKTQMRNQALCAIHESSLLIRSILLEYDQMLGFVTCKVKESATHNLTI